MVDLAKLIPSVDNYESSLTKDDVQNAVAKVKKARQLCASYVRLEGPSLKQARELAILFRQAGYYVSDIYKLPPQLFKPNIEINSYIDVHFESSRRITLWDRIKSWIW